MSIALIVTVGLLVYAWVVYPLVLRLLAGCRAEPVWPALADEELPHMTVLVSAFNEEAAIGMRLANLVEQDYPHGKLRILVGVDGASDGTAAIAREHAQRDNRIEIHAFAENRGKVAVLKDLVSGMGEGLSVNGYPLSGADTPGTKHQAPSTNKHLFVFTDANTHFRSDALRRLAAPFREPSVGGVCGRLVFTDGPPSVVETGLATPSAEGIYWRWETALKTDESVLDSCLGANGAIYAIRPELFWGDIPANTIIDDFVIGMKVREQGLRMVYEPDAVAYEELPDPGDEWRRRVRIGAGDYQAIRLCARSLSLRQGWFAWSFWSHKVLRWTTPHLMIVATALAGAHVFREGVAGIHGSAALGTLCGFGVMLLLGAAHRVRLPVGGVAAADHFLSMQAALLVGFLRYLRGGLKGSWSRTPRKAESGK